MWARDMTTGLVMVVPEPAEQIDDAVAVLVNQYERASLKATEAENITLSLEDLNLEPNQLVSLLHLGSPSL